MIRTKKDKQEYMKEWREKNKNNIKKNWKTWYKKNRNHLREYDKMYRKTHRPEKRAYNRIYHKQRRKNIKQAIFESLGSFYCQCKGKDCWHKGKCRVKDKRVQQLDHKKGGGRKEIKRFGNGIGIYEFYSRHPKIAKRKLQVMCANCNWVKRYTNNEVKNFTLSLK